VPVANAGPDDEACGPAYKLAAVPSDGTGTWYFPSQVLLPLPVAYNDILKIDSSFISASVSYKFYWEEKNWLCVKKDSVTITFYNRIDTISAGPGGPIMSFDNIARVKAYPIMPFETGKWSVVAGTGDFENDADTSTYVKNISLGENIYKWTVTNGKCKLEDLVTFDVFVPVIPQAISPDGDLINDTLKIGGLDLVNQEVDLTILNGAGTQVFSTSTRNGWKNWDGKNSKGAVLPEGTYYYLLKVKSIKTGNIIPKSGFIILKRN
jgi:gliding motility-associated-like protein